MSGRGSAIPRSSSRPRSARSTSARSRRRTSRPFRATRTSAASCALTPSTSGSTATSTSTSTRLASSRAGATSCPRGRRGGGLRPRERPSNGARCCSCSPGSCSWRFSSSRPSASRAPRRTCRDWGRSSTAGRLRPAMLVLHGVGRGTYVEVRHNRASGKVDLQATVEPGQTDRLPGRPLLPPRAHARRPPRHARRPRGCAAGRAQPPRPRHTAADDSPSRVSERPRAVVVVTGSELVRGERTDRNGPFLAAEALSNGLEPARITIVGDSPAELETALRVRDWRRTRASSPAVSARRTTIARWRSSRAQPGWSSSWTKRSSRRSSRSRARSPSDCGGRTGTSRPV